MREDRKDFSRRDFLLRIGGATLAAPLLAACRVENAADREAAAAAVLGEEAASCTDVSGLTADEIEVRRRLQYTDSSPHSDKRCNNCKLFQPPQGDAACGGCASVPGPIHPRGYCTAWVEA